MVERIADALEVEAAKLFTMKAASPKVSAARVKDEIKVLFYEFVRETLQEIADQE